MSREELTDDRTLLPDYTASDFVDDVSLLASKATRSDVPLPFAAEALCRSAGLLSALEHISAKEGFAKKGDFKYYVPDKDFQWDDGEVLCAWKESWDKAVESMSGGYLIKDRSAKGDVLDAEKMSAGRTKLTEDEAFAAFREVLDGNADTPAATFLKALERVRDMILLAFLEAHDAGTLPSQNGDPLRSTPADL